jgi:uncharacterized protein (DUF1499 family)
MILSWLSFYDALLAAGLMAAGLTAAHYGLTPPFRGFQIFLIGFFFAVLAFLIGVVAIFLTQSPARRSGRPRAILGTVLALLLAAPVLLIVSKHRAIPINDITTDELDPPQFIAAVDLPANRGRNMGYDPKFAVIQHHAYPSLAPLRLPGTPDEVYKRVEIIAGEIPDWQITRNDPQTRELEGVATSKLFKFQDDFIIEVRPGEGGMSVVQMRSKSRDGVSDLGTNYDRIVSFWRDVQAGPHTAPPGSAQVQP